MEATLLWPDQRPLAKQIANTPGAVEVLNECLARVRSCTTEGRSYTITHIGQEWSCECDHYLKVGRQCVHALAVRYHLQPEPEAVAMVKAKPQAAYDAAQTNEIHLFDALLADLMAGVEEPEQHMGRPRVPIRDAFFCAVQKVHSQLSCRRARALFENAAGRGQIPKAPSFVISSRLLNREDATPILHDLITKSALPIAHLESAFAVDSTGFRTTGFGAYCQQKHGERKQHQWLKAHAFVGTKTHIVAKVAITNSDGSGSADSPNFAPLVAEANRAGFRIHEVSADKAYSSRANHDAVGAIGGTAYIPFKSNATGRAHGSPLWKRAYHLFQANRADFDARYHRRSNVEAVFSAIKRKFGETLKSRNRVAQENELLCKVLAYNLTVLIHEAYESGVDLAALKQKSASRVESPGMEAH